MKTIKFLSFICFVLVIMIVAGCGSNPCEKVETQLMNCQQELESNKNEYVDESRQTQNIIVALTSERDHCWNKYIDKEPPQYNESN